MNAARVLLLLCVVGCGHRGPDPGALAAVQSLSHMPPQRKSFLIAHAAATQELVLYQGFTTALLLRSTLLTDDFALALSDERQRLLGPALSPERARSDRQALLARARRYHEVILIGDSARMRGDLFTTDDRGWQVRLLADGVEQPLIHLEEVRRPDPIQAQLFPQLTPWSSFYTARFDRTVADPLGIELHVGSGYGHGTLRWSLPAPDPEPRSP